MITATLGSHRNDCLATNLLGPVERTAPVEAILAVDDVQHLETLGVELALEVVLVDHSVVQSGGFV